MVKICSVRYVCDTYRLYGCKLRVESSISTSHITLGKKFWKTLFFSFMMNYFDYGFFLIKGDILQLTYLGYSSLIEDTVKNCSFESLFPSMLELAFLLLELVETVERKL